jgi:hypothetical protein
MLLACLSFCWLTASAQDTMAKSGSSSKTQVTGCLQKGDEAGGYTITGEDGKLFELHSTSVDLSQHLGHKVTVTGHVQHKSKTQESQMQAHESKEANGQAYKDLSVSNLKMVSESCQ